MVCTQDKNYTFHHLCVHYTIQKYLNIYLEKDQISLFPTYCMDFAYTVCCLAFLHCVTL